MRPACGFNRSGTESGGTGLNHADTAAMHMNLIDSMPVDRLRGYAEAIIRAAVVLLLVCAVTSAIVATGLDLLPLHP